jgi:hypothetical protein
MRTRALLAIIAFALMAGCGLTGSPDETSAPPSQEQEPVPADCVNPPTDVSTLIKQRRAAACYGSADLTVEAHATLFLGVMDCPGALEPDWLGCGGQQVELYPLDQAGELPEFLLVARSPNRGPALYGVIHPDYDIDLHRGLDAPVTVTGHFDDPAAATCRYTAWPEGEAHSDQPEAIEGCRSRFVITRLELLDLTSDEPVEDGAFEPHDLAQVMTTNLVVRSAPGVGADSDIYDWQLDAPTILYIFDGPVTADGYDWYQVMPSNVDYLPTPYGVGWVAATGKDGELWIEPAQPDCPEPTLESVATLSGLGALACFGDTELALEGDLGGCAARDDEQSPSEPWPTMCWLSPFDCCPDVVPYPSGIVVWNEAVLSNAFEPQPSLVGGHFDGAPAADCVDAARDGAGPIPAGWGTYVCRTSFVVTTVAPLDR